jgi:hypothetical protein
MEIRPMEFEVFQMDGQTDRHDEANGRFRNLQRRLKTDILFQVTSIM